MGLVWIHKKYRWGYPLPASPSPRIYSDFDLSAINKGYLTRGTLTEYRLSVIYTVEHLYLLIFYLIECCIVYVTRGIFC